MTAVARQTRHDCRDLIQLFEQAFARSHRTLLVGGAEEPLYQPAASEADYHRIEFTRDYYASALHEVAHWCVAGARRRQQEDYGYWYSPDGRSEAQQAEFERVEVYPQTLEWFFSVAAGAPFRVSADNLALDCGPSEAFKDAIAERAVRLCREPLPRRVGTFAEALLGFYRPGRSLKWLCQPANFPREAL